MRLRNALAAYPQLPAALLRARTRAQIARDQAASAVTSDAIATERLAADALARADAQMGVG